MRLYIAYGSNLNKSAMRQRCFDARPLGSFYLTDARLVFRGVADVEYWQGSQVPCGLWEISDQDEKALDRYEGVDSGLYYKDYSILLRHRGRERRALIYMMRSTGVYPPSEGYLQTIEEGYRDFGLDTAWLYRAVSASYEGKSPDAQTQQRRSRQRKSNRRAVRQLAALRPVAARSRQNLDRSVPTTREDFHD